MTVIEDMSRDLLIAKFGFTNNPKWKYLLLGKTTDLWRRKHGYVEEVIVSKSSRLRNIKNALNDFETKRDPDKEDFKEYRIIRITDEIKEVDDIYNMSQFVALYRELDNIDVLVRMIPARQDNKEEDFLKNQLIKKDMERLKEHLNDLIKIDLMKTIRHRTVPEGEREYCILETKDWTEAGRGTRKNRIVFVAWIDTLEYGERVIGQFSSHRQIEEHPYKIYLDGGHYYYDFFKSYEEYLRRS